MRVVDPTFEIYLHVPMNLDTGESVYPQGFIERVGRTCYQSEGKITDGSASRFIAKLWANGHGAMVEHCSASVRFVCDRGVSHEMVRHRLASFAQESTRYCNYSKEKFGSHISVIDPKKNLITTDAVTAEEVLERRHRLYELIEEEYNWEISKGIKPQIARGVLPTALKTEIWMTANLREWMHVFSLRCAFSAHPQIQELMNGVQEVLAVHIPELFGPFSALAPAETRSAEVTRWTTPR